MIDKQKEQIKSLEDQELEEVKEKGAVISEDRSTDKGMMKIDLHCHTEVSWDCMTPIERFPQRLIQQGIKVQAITDHNEIRGAKKLKKIVENKDLDLTIIVGEEILTSEGELLGLFLREKIEKGMSPERTIEEIHDQGGVCLLPHGFDPLKGYRLSEDARKRIEDELDVVETFNTRVSSNRWNKAAVEYAASVNKLMSSGSDAHTLKDVGTAWVEVPVRDIKNSQDLLEALKGGVPTGTWVNPIQSLVYRVWDMASNLAFGWRKTTEEV